MNRNFLTVLAEIITINIICATPLGRDNFRSTSESETKTETETESLPGVRIATEDLQTRILQQTFCSQGPLTCHDAGALWSG